MINNRTTGGSRRRGRGGSRPNSNSRGPNDGSRLDSRARGNASQLHEKYKSMARDAQTQGDRVIQEYYLQFADHYFRILSEANARKEESNRPRQSGSSRDDDDYDDEAEGSDDAVAASDDDRDDRQPVRADRDGNRGDGNRSDGNRGDGNRGDDRNGRSRYSEPRPPRGQDDEERIEVDRLPAAISASSDDAGDEPAAPDAEPAKAPRRRSTRSRVRKDGDDEAVAV